MTLRFEPTYVYKSIGLEVNNLSFILNSSDNQKSYEQRLLCSLYNYLIVEEVDIHSWNENEVADLLLKNISYLPDEEYYFHILMRVRIKEVLGKLDLTESYKAKLKLIGFDL